VASRQPADCRPDRCTLLEPEVKNGARRLRDSRSGARWAATAPLRSVGEPEERVEWAARPARPPRSWRQREVLGRIRNLLQAHDGRTQRSAHVRQSRRGIDELLGLKAPAATAWERLTRALIPQPRAPSRGSAGDDMARAMPVMSPANAPRTRNMGRGVRIVRRARHQRTPWRCCSPTPQRRDPTLVAAAV